MKYFKHYFKIVSTGGTRIRLRDYEFTYHKYLLDAKKRLKENIKQEPNLDYKIVRVSAYNTRTVLRYKKLTYKRHTNTFGFNLKYDKFKKLTFGV